eukprot:g30934.t1
MGDGSQHLLFKFCPRSLLDFRMEPTALRLHCAWMQPVASLLWGLGWWRHQSRLEDPFRTANATGLVGITKAVPEGEEGLLFGREPEAKCFTAWVLSAEPSIDLQAPSAQRVALQLLPDGSLWSRRDSATYWMPVLPHAAVRGTRPTGSEDRRKMGVVYYYEEGKEETTSNSSSREEQKMERHRQLLALNKMKIVKFLKENGFHREVNARRHSSEADYSYPLHEAVKMEKVAMVEMLLRFGAKSHLKDSKGLEAIATTRTEILKIFEMYRCPNGWEPLFAKLQQHPYAMPPAAAEPADAVAHRPTWAQRVREALGGTKTSREGPRWNFRAVAVLWTICFN